MIGGHSPPYSKRREMIKVGIIGGTGYTGVELLRLLAMHPQVEVRVITSRGEAWPQGRRSFPESAWSY